MPNAKKAWRLAWGGFLLIACMAAFFAGYFAGTRSETPVATANAKRNACITDLRSDLDQARTRKQNAVDARDNLASQLTIIEAQALATDRSDDPDRFQGFVQAGLELVLKINSAQQLVDARQVPVDKALDRIDRLNDICPPVT